MEQGQKLLKTVLFCWACLFSVSLFSVGTLADIVVVVNPQLKVKALTTQQISDIFLGKTNELPTGEPITPVLQNEGGTIHEEFNLQVHGRDKKQLRAYWSRLVFTGKGNPPPYFDDAEEVKDQISDNPEIISYIDSSEVDEKVKVVGHYP